MNLTAKVNYLKLHMEGIRIDKVSKKTLHPQALSSEANLERSRSEEALAPHYPIQSKGCRESC